MRKSNLIIILATSFLIMGCFNVTDFSQEDAKKQTWLYPFVDNYTILEGKYDIHNDIIKFFISVNSYSEFIYQADSIAQFEKWETCYLSESARVFIKNIPYMDGREDVFIIKINHYKPEIVEFTIY